MGAVYLPDNNSTSLREYASLPGGHIQCCTLSVSVNGPCLKFTQNWRAVETKFGRGMTLTQVTGSANVRSKNQGHRELNVKIVFKHIFVKVDRFTSNQHHNHLQSIRHVVKIHFTSGSA